MADSTYKLTYFKIAGLGEGIRFLFAYADVEFEDNRLEMTEWPTFKQDFPFHQVPVLEVNGVVLTQSKAIARFLGKRFGLTTDDELRDAQIEAVVDHLRDFSEKRKAETMLKTPEAKKATEEAVEFIFSRLNNLADQGYFCGSESTWVDVVFAGMMDAMSAHTPDFLMPYPNLTAIVEKVKSKDSVKKYLKRRPSNPCTKQ